MQHQVTITASGGSVGPIQKTAVLTGNAEQNVDVTLTPSQIYWLDVPGLGLTMKSCVILSDQSVTITTYKSDASTIVAGPSVVAAGIPAVWCNDQDPIVTLTLDGSGAAKMKVVNGSSTANASFKMSILYDDPITA